MTGEAEKSLPVYLVHFNKPDWLASSVSSVLCSRGVSVELAVVDNGSPVELSSILPEGARILSARRNLGFAGGANLAIADCRQRHPDSGCLIIGSHDLHVEADTFRLLMGAAEANPAFGILAPDIAGRPDRSIGGTPVGPVISTSWVSGTCMLLTRRCLDDVEEFDSRFESYLEDVEICLRASDAGWRIGVVQSSHASGLGTAHGRQRDVLIASNTVLLAFQRGGRRHGAIALVRLLGDVIRSAVGALLPWRGKESRMASRGRARSRVRAVRRAARITRKGNERQRHGTSGLRG